MHTFGAVLLFGLSAGTATVALGHDLYLLPDRFRVSPGETLGIALHNGDAFPESEASVKIARIRDAALRSGTSVSKVSALAVQEKRKVGTATVPGSGTLLLTVRTVPNFIEMTPDKFVSYLEEEGLTEIVKWRKEHGETARPGRERYSKYAKALLVAGQADEGYRRAAGFVIEIIPEKDPYQLKPGDALPVQVLFRNEPAADLALEAAWVGAGGEKKIQKIQVIGRTDSNGRISVPLTAAGRWRLHSIKMERCAEPKVADWESSWASLTFEVR
jgi:uncharacterized GH25 family protein